MDPETEYYPQDHPWIEIAETCGAAQEIGLSEKICTARIDLAR